MVGSVALLAAACAFNSGNYDVLSVDVSHPRPSLERVVYHVEADHKSLNRFLITHVSRQGQAILGRPLLLLSPFALPGAFYEISETGDYGESAAAQLAEAGADVWLVDQRQTHLPAGSCEANAATCSAMAGWDNNAVADDALFALSLLKAYHPFEKPVVGGFSAGSSGALATVNREPDAFSGVFMYEGTLYNKDPTIAAHNDPICTSLTSQIAAGTYFNDSFGAIGEALQLAHSDPSGLSPIPGFPPGTTNEQSMFFIFGTPPPPTALSPTATFVRNIVDFTTQQFVYTNQQRLELVGPQFDQVGSLPALRDLACGLSGHDDQFVTNVGRFRGDLLVYVEGTGFGQAMFDTAALFDHASSKTIDQHTEFGDSDPYFAFKWHEDFLDPLVAWLRRTR
jgi:pimeloyl-ACP methyl ester carboxylesterase